MIRPWTFEETPGAAPTGEYYDLKALAPGIAIASAGLVHVVELPLGYEYVTELDASDAATLFRGHYPNQDTLGPKAWQYRESQEAREGVSGLYVGVSEIKSNVLVGLGQLSYRGSFGCLSNFVVHTEHRGRAIGKAIIDDRLELATALGLTMISIPRLESTNRLQSYYHKHGFTETEYGALVRRQSGRSTAS